MAEEGFTLCVFVRTYAANITLYLPNFIFTKFYVYPLDRNNMSVTSDLEWNEDVMLDKSDESPAAKVETYIQVLINSPI